MTNIKLAGEVTVMNGFNKLLEFILGFSEEAVEISKLPGNNRYENDEVNILGLDYRDGSQAEHQEHENNADKYAKLKSFKHG
jgi:hypothetical protein